MTISVLILLLVILIFTLKPIIPQCNRRVLLFYIFSITISFTIMIMREAELLPHNPSQFIATIKEIFPFMR